MYGLLPIHCSQLWAALTHLAPFPLPYVRPVFSLTKCVLLSDRGRATGDVCMSKVDSIINKDMQGLHGLLRAKLDVWQLLYLQR